jgi:hypothetical protein
MAAAREALGGEKRLSEIKSFVAVGRTRQVRGNNLVPIEFVISCQLPDKYVRKDEIPAQESEPSSSGFNGDALIQIPPPPVPPAMPVPGGAPNPAAAPPRSAAVPLPPSGPGMPPGGPAGPPMDPRKARVTSIKQDFARLTLGMFATSFSSYPLTFSLVGQAEAPQGKADVIEVKGEGTFALKLFIHSEQHLPLMLSWTVPATNAVVTAPGQPAPENLAPGTIVVQGPPAPTATATKDEQAAYARTLVDLRRQALAGKLVEQRLYFGDYRDAGNGVTFPFRLRRSIGGVTTEETNFDSFDINKRIDPKRFEPVK